MFLWTCHARRTKARQNNSGQPDVSRRPEWAKVWVARGRGFVLAKKIERTGLKSLA
jgi:hypothetical protein